MRVAVLGAGQMGGHLLRQLSRLPEQPDVILIEKDPATAKHFGRKFDISVVEADASIAAVLETHARDADVLFALTDDDAVNIVAALTATHPAIGVERAVARISDPRHQDGPLLRDSALIETILPEALVAEEILGLIRFPGARSVRSLGRGGLVLIRAVPNREAVFGVPLASIDSAPRGWILTGILRRSGSSGEPHLIIPRGSTCLREGDEVFAVGPAAEADNYLRAIGIQREPARRVIVAGYGQVGAQLLQRLPSKIDVTIIRRTEVAGDIPGHPVILRGDATDEDILHEADVGSADFFIAATDADEVNFMAAWIASKAGARDTIALHNRAVFAEPMRRSGVDFPIFPASVVVGALLKPLHSRAMVRLDWIEGGGEIVEIEVAEGSPATRFPLAALGLPPDSIVGELVRPGVGAFVPDGGACFEPGDIALIFFAIRGGPDLSGPEATIAELERLFAGAS